MLKACLRHSPGMTVVSSRAPPSRPASRQARRGMRPSRRTIGNAGRALAMGKDTSDKAARQLEAARALARELGNKLDLNASLRLWDGSLTPLGQNVTGPFELIIADAGVIGSLLRWPTLDNFIRHYVDKGIDFAGGTLIDLGSQLNHEAALGKAEGTRRAAASCASSIRFSPRAPSTPPTIRASRARSPASAARRPTTRTSSSSTTTCRTSSTRSSSTPRWSTPAPTTPTGTTTSPRRSATSWK